MENQNQDQQTQLDEIYSKLEAGDISVPEVIKQSNALTAEITAKEVLAGANKRSEEIQGERDFETAEKKFLGDHPDYEELVASGTLQPFIDANPLLVDETIAYFQYKAKEAFEKGKEGSGVVKEVQMGSFPRTPRRRSTPLSPEEIERRQFQIVKQMRGE